MENITKGDIMKKLILLGVLSVLLYSVPGYAGKEGKEAAEKAPAAPPAAKERSEQAPVTAQQVAQAKEAWEFLHAQKEEMTKRWNEENDQWKQMNIPAEKAHALMEKAQAELDLFDAPESDAYEEMYRKEHPDEEQAAAARKTWDQVHAQAEAAREKWKQARAVWKSFYNPARNVLEGLRRDEYFLELKTEECDRAYAKLEKLKAQFDATDQEEAARKATPKAPEDE